MKKSLIMCAAICCLTVGCKGTAYTSQGVYLGALHEVEMDMQAMGFQPIGSGQETINETYVFDDEWKNDWVTYDARRFVDSLGYEAAYTVRYRAVEDGVRTVEVAGCEVSHPDDYSAICGDDGVVQRINRLQPDKHSKRSAAAGVFLGSCLAIPVLIVAILMAD